MKRFYSILIVTIMMLIPMGMMGQTTTYSLTPDQESTGSSSTTYITSLTEFTYNSVTWEMNQWNPSNLQIKTNQSSAASEFRFYNTTAMPGRITQVVLKFSALTLSSTSNTGFMFVGGTSAITTTTGGSAGTWNATEKTITWVPSSSDNFTYFAFYQNGKVATGTNKLATEDAIVVTYETGSTPTPTTYTVTYDCNGGTTGCPENVTGIEAGTTITLANAPTKDGFDFAGWNDGNNTYNAGDEYTVNGNVTFTAQWTEVVSGDVHWVLTDLANLTSSDVFVIVGNNGSNYAMSNDNGTDPAPSAVAVTVTGNEITSTVAANIQWNISGNATNGYTFYPNGSTTTWLYCTNTNNGVRVGTNANKTFVVDHNYLKHISTSRYVGVYNSQDWRCYTSYTTTNIANQTFAFYKKVTGSVLPPSITANNVNIAYDATSGEIAYTLNNPASNGSLSASANVNWISNLVFSTTENKVTFTTTANEATTAREGIVTITYTYGSDIVSKDVTITQAAAPMTYTTIPALFAAATTDETPVFVTFNNWVVSGVSTNGKNVFVTDNNGNGFVIFFGSDMSGTFAEGNILSGTAVACDLKKYNGFAELLNVNANDLTITTGGTVSTANVDMANLAGVNTSALVSYNNLNCTVTTTTSGENTYTNYDLSDGTTTIRAYGSLFSDYSNYLENGKSYNIIGVYQQYNSTKEILPRSANDIVEVVAPVSQYTLTVTASTNVEIYTFVGDSNEGVEGSTTMQVNNGTEVGLSASATEGYVLTLMVDGTDVTSQLDETGYYTFNMPTHDVTVTATAVEQVIPSSDDYVRITSLDQLTNGSKVVFAARYNTNVNEYYAMGNTLSGDKFPGTAFTSSSEKLPATITNDINSYYWTVSITTVEGVNYYTFANANGQVVGWLSGTKFKLGDSEAHNEWTISTGTTKESSLVANYSAFNINNVNTSSRAFAFRHNETTNVFGPYAISGQNNNSNNEEYNFSLDIFVQGASPVTEYTLTIEGYGNDNSAKGGWNLIAFPVSTTPDQVVNMLTNTYDLYRFNQSVEKEWENYQQHGNDFVLEPGKGYLYAHSGTGEVNLTYGGTLYEGTNVFPLTFAETVVHSDMQGLNLLGNPYNTNVTINKDFYIMNGDGSEVVIAGQNQQTIAPNQGFFVKATEAGQSVTFTKQSKNGKSAVELNLSQNRGGVIDRAIVRFGNSNTLPKFQLFENSTKLYIAQDGKDYAIVGAEAQGEMPVSFKASENGSYTISINTNEVEMNYLHLIDNLTGNDVDLLATPSYTFNARTDDYASRFRLVFSTGNADSDSFAFVSNGQIVLTEQGNAQVYDITGRLVNSYNNVNSISTEGMTAGVYVIRLTNGSETMTQKIVVK